MPDSISTLAIGSMERGHEDQVNVMSKFLALGLSLDDVIKQSTWNPARDQAGRPRHLSVGAGRTSPVLRLENGSFGFVDSFGGACARSRSSSAR